MSESPRYSDDYVATITTSILDPDSSLSAQITWISDSYLTDPYRNVNADRLVDQLRWQRELELEQFGPGPPHTLSVIARVESPNDLQDALNNMISWHPPGPQPWEPQEPKVVQRFVNHIAFAESAAFERSPLEFHSLGSFCG